VADIFNIYEKESHGGGGDYGVKAGHQKGGYVQQTLLQQQQQQQPEYQDDVNGGGGGGGEGQPDFWGPHEQQVADFTTAANETLAAANALQIQEVGLGQPDGSIQVTQQYAIFQTGNPGPSWIDEHYDQSAYTQVVVYPATISIILLRALTINQSLGATRVKILRGYSPPNKSIYLK